MPDDLRPGELHQVGAAVTVTEYPSVLPGLVELAEVPGHDPVLRLVLVATCRPLVGELEHVVIQPGEYLAGHHRPVVGRPPAHDRVDRAQYRSRVRSPQGPELGAQPFPDPSDRRLTRLDKQLSVVAANVEPQEIEPAVGVDNPSLVLVERQAPGRQPLGQSRFDLFGLHATAAHHHEIIREPHRCGAALLDPPGISAGRVVADPGGLLQPVQGHVKQQRTDHPALRGSLLGRGEPAAIDHSRPQPLPDPVPGWERAERGQQTFMINSVECRRQVGVEYPHPLRVLALQRGIDGPDRVVTATAGPKSVGLRLELCLPGGFQR